MFDRLHTHESRCNTMTLASSCQIAARSPCACTFHYTSEQHTRTITGLLQLMHPTPPATPGICHQASLQSHQLFRYIYSSPPSAVVRCSLTPPSARFVQVIDRVQHPSVDGNCFYVAHPNLGPNWRATNSIGQISESMCCVIWCSSQTPTHLVVSCHLLSPVVDVVRDFSARPPKVVGGPRPPPFGGAPAQQPPPRGPPVSAGGGFPGAPGAGAARGPGPMPGMGTVPYPGPGAVMWPPRGGPSAGGPPSYDQAHGPGGGGGAGGGAGAASSTGAGGSMPPGGKTGDDTEDGFEATDLPPIPTNFPRLHGKR